MKIDMKKLIAFYWFQKLGWSSEEILELDKARKKEGYPQYFSKEK